jgi:hypothetical protein
MLALNTHHMEVRMDSISIRLEVTSMGKVFFIERTSDGICSIMARVSELCLANEHGNAAHIADVIAFALCQDLELPLTGHVYDPV